MKRLMAILLSLSLPSVSLATSSDGLVGAGGNLTTGQSATFRQAPDRSLGNQETHAKFQQAVRDGNVYICISTGAMTTAAGMSVTQPAMTLYNPVGSGKNLVIIEDQIALNAAPAAADIFVLAVTTGAPTSTSVNGAIYNAALPYSASIGAVVSPIGQCYRQAVLATAPIPVRIIGQVTGASGLTPPTFTDYVDGKIIVGPGVGIAFQTTSAAAIYGMIEWEEIPNP